MICSSLNRFVFIVRSWWGGLQSYRVLNSGVRSHPQRKTHTAQHWDCRPGEGPGVSRQAESIVVGSGAIGRQASSRNEAVVKYLAETSHKASQSDDRTHLRW